MMGCTCVSHHLIDDCLYNNKFLGNQSYHLLALLLSVTVHLGLGLALGNGKSSGGGGVLPQQESRTAIVAYLKAPDSAAEPAALLVLADLKKTDSVVNVPEPGIAKYDRSATESTDSAID